jgi:5-methylthioadenosine/S-adenosylhomocysteine deaminase
VDDKTFLAMRTEAEEHDVRVHIHLHETKQEVDDHVPIHKKRPIERLNDLKLLNNKLIAVHMTQLTDEEIQLIAKSGKLTHRI